MSNESNDPVLIISSDCHAGTLPAGYNKAQDYITTTHGAKLAIAHVIVGDARSFTDNATHGSLLSFLVGRRSRSRAVAVESERVPREARCVGRVRLA